jgi:diguanylate cyclase (GGDEF)-like protein
MWTLLIHGKLSGPENYVLKRGFNSLGRMPDNDICIIDDSISRYHAEIHYNHEQKIISIRDLKSTNGVYVNGEKIDNIRYLEQNDQIQIGTFIIILTAPPEPEPQFFSDLSSTPGLFIESIDNFASLLDEIQDCLSSEDDFEKAFTEVARATKEMINADECQVLSLENVYTLCEKGITADLIQDVLNRNRPVITSDNQAVNTVDEKTVPHGLTSTLLAPIAVEGKPIALIYSARNLSAKNPFNQQDLQLLVAISHQISNTIERNKTESELRESAFNDPLTGLPNRSVFLDRLKYSLARKKRDPNFKFALLFADVDNFKDINDSLGHMVGDKLLIQLANLMNENLREIDTIGRNGIMARLGGDEFAILLDDLKEDSDAMIVAKRLLNLVEKPFKYSGKEIRTGISIGITFSSLGYERSEDMLRDADVAMYRAKELGRNRVEIYDRKMQSQVTKRLDTLTALRNAIQSDEFLLYYQPIISLKTGRIVGLEALLRWNSPVRGFLSPDKFMYVSDTAGLVTRIDHWVIENACHQLNEWQGQFSGNQPLCVSVNLSPKQINNPLLAEHVEHILKETNLDASNLCLEITENANLGNEEATLTMLKELHEKGVRLSLDDFGTGYSALVYLVNLPLDTIKIDDSFIRQLGINKENKIIIESLKMLATQLGIELVAEGIEKEEQLAFLKELGCEYGQGFLFSEPLSAEEMTELLKKNPQWQ